MKLHNLVLYQNYVTPMNTLIETVLTGESLYLLHLVFFHLNFLLFQLRKLTSMFFFNNKFHILWQSKKFWKKPFITFVKPPPTYDMNSYNTNKIIFSIGYPKYMSNWFDRQNKGMELLHCWFRSQYIQNRENLHS